MRYTREDDVLVPIRAVRCPFCERWVTTDGLTAMETMWMHEYDCESIVLDYELAAVA